ncbi:MAG: RagB/SusD family nutrient uptake outer membrane protein [Alistipes ihumii]
MWYCSYFLSRINTANVTNEQDRQRWKAEAHVLRAFYYMSLMRLHGTKLPVRNEPFEMYEDISNVKPASITELTDFILSDCDSAINTDALPWRITTSAEQQRVTKAVAWAIKSRVMLYAASPLYNGGNNLWDKAYEVTQDAYNAIKGAGYELYKTSKIEEYTNDQALITPEDYPDDQAAAAAALNEYFCEWHDYGGGATWKRFGKTATATGRSTISAASACRKDTSPAPFRRRKWWTPTRRTRGTGFST